jgi:hypothetical protein
MAAASFMETARPPASSDELTIREPLDKRCKLFCNDTLVIARLLADAVAAELVLIDSDMVLSLLD